MIWFTADQHFGHENIIKHCGRPFSSVEEMDEEMVLRWNERVGPDDLVYHLGDLTLQGIQGKRDLVTGEALTPPGAVDYLCQLNGAISILGNPWHHDGWWLNALSSGRRMWSLSGHRVKVLPPIVVLELTNIPPVILCHYPITEWDRKHYGAWHLHAHSHGKHRGEGLILDVGVDCHDFYPVALDGVRERFGG